MIQKVIQKKDLRTHNEIREDREYWLSRPPQERLAAVEEGLFAGLSSGANVAGAVRLAGEIDAGTIVTIICDRGDRYLSTMLFRSVCAKCPP